MNPLQSEARAFLERRQSVRAFSVQRAALFLTSGIDLDEALHAPAERRRAIRLRLERLIERERLRGVRRHWSYDLNRHIALKQALLRIVAQEGGKAASHGATATVGLNRPMQGPGDARPPGNRPEPLSDAPRACGRGPSSSQAASGLRRSSAPPSDRSRRGPTSPGTGPA